MEKPRAGPKLRLGPPIEAPPPAYGGPEGRKRAASIGGRARLAQYGREYQVELAGRGGRRRAEVLPPERRSEIGHMAAAALEKKYGRAAVLAICAAGTEGNRQRFQREVLQRKFMRLEVEPREPLGEPEQGAELTELIGVIDGPGDL